MWVLLWLKSTAKTITNEIYKIWKKYGKETNGLLNEHIGLFLSVCHPSQQSCSVSQLPPHQSCYPMPRKALPTASYSLSVSMVWHWSFPIIDCMLPLASLCSTHTMACTTVTTQLPKTWKTDMLQASTWMSPTPVLFIYTASVRVSTPQMSYTLLLNTSSSNTVVGAGKKHGATTWVRTCILRCLPPWTNKLQLLQ